MIRPEKPFWYGSLDCIAYIFLSFITCARYCRVTNKHWFTCAAYVMETCVNSSLMLSSGIWLCVNLLMFNVAVHMLFH